ncbi:hypothetical protein JVT61DRAFT_7202 [Boletus reticuloceps]|uniref:Uncharacterized protein n=1 Tax=Boletus reticuloceps TaxID=495285 RepID=A0A8I2YJH9_9AGAM|nr:hypothetical protein JVT61DRAFT_7202 [Boletus reticuloceps]
MKREPEEPIGGRPKRTAAPSAKLRDSDNAATPELCFHQQAQHVPDCTTSTPPSNSSRSPSPMLPTRKHKNASKSITLSSDEEETTSERPSRLDKVRTNAATNHGTASTVNIDNHKSSTLFFILAAGVRFVKPAPTSSIPHDKIGVDGLLKDVKVLPIDGPTTVPHKNCTRDVDQFFTPVYNSDNGKKMCTCKKCL